MAGGISETDFKKYVAEAIGAFFLTMGGMLAIIGTGDIVAIAAAHGAILGLMVYVFGPISGGHFNPAVSTALLVQKKISQRDWTMYIIFQVLGATIGALFAVAVATGPGETWTENAAKGATLGKLTFYLPPPFTVPGFNPFGAMFLEIFLTFMLATTVSMVVKGGEKMASLSGILIGGTLFCCILWGGAWTGASLNPARSIGPAIASGTSSLVWTTIWVYIAGPLIGAVLAAAAFMWFQGDLKIHLTASAAAPAPPALPPPPPPSGLPPPPPPLPSPYGVAHEPPKPPSL